MPDTNDITTISKEIETRSETVTTVYSDSYSVQVQTIKNEDGLKFQHALVLSQGDSFLNTICGETELIKLLLKAVNNRTIERDYFKLYCDMLDSSITEEEFDRVVSSNESDYIIDETYNPTTRELSIAANLIKYIKGINTIDDFTSIFSFKPNSINQILTLENE